MASEDNPIFLYHYRSSVKIGELERYYFAYDFYDDDDDLPEDLDFGSLWVKVKNISNLTYRAAYLMGPYVLYCDVRTKEYHHSQKLFASADQPQFDSTIQPQQEFIAELSLHKLQKKYFWIVEVISQIIFTSNTQIAFEITIATSKEAISEDIALEPTAGSFSNRITVNRQTTLDLWNLPQQIFDDCLKPEHLVILTHGLHSNITADLNYLKEQIEDAQRHYPNELLIVKGFMDNICKTEKGIKFLGTRLAEHIVKQLYNKRVKKISFIGHSLGGLTQTFAIAYISVNYPWFFDTVQPVNFVTLASPLLGLVTNNPVYVNMFLSMGIVGKTGQDLRLQVASNQESPLLYDLPGPITRNALKKFQKRTLYANATNDGIVPLYTSALLYLDYDDVLSQLKNNSYYRSDSQNFFTKTLFNPLIKVINLLAPQLQGDSAIPKGSILESVMSVLLPPLPDKTYIMDPSSRPNIILHDKMYSEDDIPEPNSSPSKSFWDSLLNLGNGDQYKQLEEEMAKKWHRGLTWRKVIVNLKPDAHNNIIVRRRFVNAYGWSVVDHLVQNHFNGTENSYPVGNHADSPIDEQVERDCHWINRPHNGTFFDVGLTGMISSVGEIIENFKNTAFQSNSTPNPPLPRDAFEEELFRFTNNILG
ncbi:lipase ROG1 family protein Ecym_3369 [Eremothecium cymbalariae DBVPG|uniref:DUF676 domain-containing protein n=1 Tax=Eremothecium cymbalariae (strain CBS 270.75 / DBVPG 7215 / KCTC 17166 / NRRL Y-17582) TaxID=931890 RepID=G8JRT7_ERECY|nr:Hypothetical protein Ecym_3369 [Eremothecium cymbalariae DBVPG\